MLSFVNVTHETDRSDKVDLKCFSFCDKVNGVAHSTNLKQRRSERHPIQLALVLLQISDKGEIRNEGVTVDLSQHGCRVEGAATLCEGQLVQLLPWESPGAAIAGRVVWVGPPASKLAGEAGIEFLKPLSSVV
jgi:hypothetical protein